MPSSSASDAPHSPQNFWLAGLSSAPRGHCTRASCPLGASARGAAIAGRRAGGIKADGAATLGHKMHWVAEPRGIACEWAVERPELGAQLLGQHEIGGIISALPAEPERQGS